MRTPNMVSSKKRKRNASVEGVYEGGPATKKARPSPSTGKRAAPAQVRHAVLDQYFRRVLTLRDYILSNLPDSSRIRRRKIAAIGVASSPQDGVPKVDRSVGALLDSTLVGLAGQTKTIPDDRWKQWATFSQRGDESYITLSDGLAGAVFSQSEVVDFVIWLLFSRAKTSGTWPRHLLCDGYRRDYNSGKRNPSNIPGIFSLYPNPQVERIKEAPWPQLLKLLGKCGDRIMIDLLLDCAVFSSVKAGQRNYYQISGFPLSNAEPIGLASHRPPREKDFERSPSEITFVRNRMLYARAALNARGLVHFGLRHIHVLNRSPYVQSDPEASGGSEPVSDKNNISTLRVMMYIFPRQFGMHNVFTSKVDFKETSQRLKDYTLREHELLEKFGQLSGVTKVQTPRRLRGRVRELVQRLQVLHSRCSYSKLLQHHCPIASSLEPRELSRSSHDKAGKLSQKLDKRQSKAYQQVQPSPNNSVTSKSPSLVALATPTAQVSAFCQAIVLKIIPNGFWGSNDVFKHNRNMILKKTDQFIRLRRFESMSLHEVMQGMKIIDIDWLATPRLMAHKTSQTDARKRSELFYEFLYYVFDSILIPLLRSNFYITESNTDKYRLFFFRHDVWRYVAEPSMAALKVKMFEEVSLIDANQILDSRHLGFSQVRLLPKGVTIRPIMNLGKKMVKRGSKTVLGQSINTILRPAYNVFQLEKSINPDKLGSTMFSVGDMYRRIKAFKSSPHVNSGLLYFAKVDVQSAFDTIPQSAIVKLLASIPEQRGYYISSHWEVARKPGTPHTDQVDKSKPVRKWLSAAVKDKDATTFLESLKEDQGLNKRDTIFIESLYKKRYERSDLLQLVTSHIQQNLVKIGKKYYRQKEGIPQGSVLSSTFCNYFYADLEVHVLKFLDADDCLLLRLIDDFLLITTDKSKASRFVRTMHRGVPEYGVSISPAKTLVNFDLTIDNWAVSRVGSEDQFPYCGTLINPQTLDISRDRGRSAVTTHSIYNSLTVEYTLVPGQNFQRKVLNAFKIQSHLMYLDTSLNSAPTMLSNLFSAFLETATKMWAYARCLSGFKRPGPTLVVRTIGKLVEVAFLLATSKTRRSRYPGYVCDVRKTEVAWLAYDAFLKVLGRKQSGYREVLMWLRGEMRKLSGMKEIRQGRVSRVTDL